MFDLVFVYRSLFMWMTEFGELSFLRMPSDDEAKQKYDAKPSLAPAQAKSKAVKSLISKLPASYSVASMLPTARKPKQEGAKGGNIKLPRIAKGALLENAISNQRFKATRRKFDRLGRVDHNHKLKMLKRQMALEEKRIKDLDNFKATDLNTAALVQEDERRELPEKDKLVRETLLGTKFQRIYLEDKSRLDRENREQTSAAERKVQLNASLLEKDSWRK